MGDFIENVLRGYSSEQASEAMVFVLVNYLKSKNIIDYKDFEKFYEDNFTKMLKQIVERDKNYYKEKVSS